MSEYVWTENEVIRAILPEKVDAELIMTIMTEYATYVNKAVPCKVILDLKLQSMPRDKDESIKKAFVKILTKDLRPTAPGDKVAIVICNNAMLRIGVRAILVLTGKSHCRIFNSLEKAQTWINI